MNESNSTRQATISRHSTETQIELSLKLDGSGQANINSGVGFLDHMLQLWTRHGRFDLTVSCRGDIDVDDHHSTEDIAIVLGRALDQALGQRRGIKRYGSMLLPMDEALVLAAVDISGRGYLGFDLPLPTAKVGSFDVELVKEFMLAFCREARLTLHLRLLAGENCHHIIEAAFKALGRALAQAVAIDEQRPDEIPSTKGLID